MKYTIYKHFKGNYYLASCTSAEHTETGESFVSYKALYAKDGRIKTLFKGYVRPRPMFFEIVDKNAEYGYIGPRFIDCGTISSIQVIALEHKLRSHPDNYTEGQFAKIVEKFIEEQALNLAAEPVNSTFTPVSELAKRGINRTGVYRSEEKGDRLI